MSQTKPGKFAIWIGITISSFVGYLMSAFFLMFATALAHKDVHQVPAPGFWSSFGIVWVLAIFGGAWNTWKINHKTWKALNA